MGLKIIIIGGSVAGLTLANMLEKFDGMEYILLEAYPSIAPQVDASIGLLPNGLRILEQLGTGYPCVWLDRKMLLQTLYDNLKYKDNVLPNKRVVGIETTESGVTVYTKDGSTYRGDILVGADGVHSIAREEMWRIGEISRPEIFRQGEDTNKSAYVAISAPRNRVYWFMFVALRKTHHGSANIPRFTKLDEAALAAAHADDRMTEDMTFGQLYDSRITSALVALEEIVLVGDSAHKVHPITAQGGNGAIESAAHLINALTKLPVSAQSPDFPGSPFTEETIEAALSTLHASRSARAEKTMLSGRRTGSLLCLDFPFSKYLFRWLVPRLGDDIFLKEMLAYSVSGPRVEGLSVVERAHKTPFDDEVPPGAGTTSWDLGTWSSGTWILTIRSLMSPL
ncbi:hypothetical protein BDP81DRAFT_478104 [Colletotrichum phormii]|uniref:FAD-binding domain-containing protein n=1 Tax=Colletotrichum phormii TaxID=359342 RepID=A0AAJ0EJZ6_9PEZI|nr:uncharacterized protein BDP81DRAFT_478104 [Colletotrichum phormii]KAK1654616.1 hypothetical protein BDP81DRAFT_478104 [Colletotrichum phormii]